MFFRNLRHVWEESSGHQELQTDLCVVVDTRMTGDMSRDMFISQPALNASFSPLSFILHVMFEVMYFWV